MNATEWLCLPGTRYRCAPLYLSVDELDPLAAFFLDALRYERSVSRLVRAFDLTDRVVEDILGDLIRRNRAVLVVQDGVKELRRVEDAPESVVHQRGDTLDVWQDHGTGLVLPAWMVAQHSQRPAEAGATQAVIAGGAEGRLIEEFLSAPDSQIIEMLLRSDSQLRQYDNEYALLDRLTDRFRVRPQSLWLPVRNAEVQGRVIPLVASEHFPSWVTRVLAVGLRRGTAAGGGDVGVHAALSTDEDGRRRVHGWRAVELVENWQGAVDQFLQQLPPPVSGYDLRQVREQEAPLTSLLHTVARIELVEATVKGPGPWFAPVLESSREWALMALPNGSSLDVLLGYLQEGAGPERELPSNLVVVLPRSAEARVVETDELLAAAAGPVRFAKAISRDWPERGPALVVGDWPVARLYRHGSGQALELAGTGIASECLGVLQSLGPFQEGGESIEQLVRRWRVRRTPRQGLDEVRFGVGPDARSAAQLVGDLRAFGESLVTAIVDPELLVQEAAGGGGGRGAAVSVDRSRTIAQQVPSLCERREVLAHQLSLAPSTPWASWVRLSSFELLPSLLAVLSEPRRRAVAGELHVLASDIAPGALSTPVGELLQRAVLQDGWSVSMLVDRPEESRREATDAEVRAIQERLGAGRLQILAASPNVPVNALVLGDLVFAAGESWLAEVVAARANLAGFGIESRDLAESLRARFARAARW